MHADALKANPGASAQELKVFKRDALWKAIRAAQKEKSQDEMDSSFPTPLSLGAFKPASPQSLQAQPKSETLPKANFSALSLTKEERGPVFEAT